MPKESMSKLISELASGVILFINTISAKFRSCSNTTNNNDVFKVNLLLNLYTKYPRYEYTEP